MNHGVTLLGLICGILEGSLGKALDDIMQRLPMKTEQVPSVATTSALRKPG